MLANIISHANDEQPAIKVACVARGISGHERKAIPASLLSQENLFWLTSNTRLEGYWSSVGDQVNFAHHDMPSSYPAVAPEHERK